MQFSCDSCHATLQIADEKVKGKRLVVRCKRCGNKINIADPALAGGGAARVAQAQAPQRPISQELKPVDPDAGQPKGDTDTESTRAMETAVLEEALRASKAAGDDASGQMQPVAGPQPAPAAVPRDPPIWFAMVGGKQLGPMSRAELGLKTAQGAVGPRTYVWREGMGAWQRAKDVGELSSLFAPAPEKPAPSAPPPAPAATPAGGNARPAANANNSAGAGLRELSVAQLEEVSVGGNKKPSDAPERAGQNFREFSSQDFSAAALQAAEDLLPGVKSKGPAAGAAAQKSTPPAAQKPLPAKKPEPHRALETSGEALKPLHMSDEFEERTNVESMPLGERVHQEAVAKELFTSGEQGGASALDLARWASEELGPKEPRGPGATGPNKPVELPAPAAAAAAPAPAPRPERPVPALAASAAFEPREPAGAAGGNRSARLAIIAAAVLILGALVVYALTRSEPPPVKVETASPHGQPTPDAPKPPDQAQQPAQQPAQAKADGSGSAAAAGSGSEAAPAAAAGSGSGSAAAAGSGSAEAPAAPPAQQAAPATAVAPVAGGLSKADFDRIVIKNRPSFRKCVDEALRRTPGMKLPKMVIELVIAPTGKVSEASIDRADVQDSDFGQCLLGATRRMSFPKFPGPPSPGRIPLFQAQGGS